MYHPYDWPVVATIDPLPQSGLMRNEHVPLLVDLIEKIPHGSPVAIDTETTGLHPYETDVLRGISIAFEDRDFNLRSFYIPVGYVKGSLRTEAVQRIFRALKGRDPFLLLHHGKFDFTFLRQLPMDTDGSIFFPFSEPHQWWDTKVVAWLLDENVPNGLKEQAEFHWGKEERQEQTEIQKLVRKKGWDGLEAHEIADYAVKDTELTYRLYKLQCSLIAEAHPSVLGDIRPAIERELAIQGVLFRMERTGILINQALVEKMRADTEIVVDDLEREFQKETGYSINSPKQLAKFLYDDLELPHKSRSTARAVLETLPQDNLFVKSILLHRRAKKAMTGYLVPLGARIGYDGRVHPSFKSTGTVTGRFSCSDPNLQTIPRADTLAGVRDVFIADDGFELWEYDLQAAEMRVVAGMAGEQVLIDALNEGRDMHGALAAQVFGEKWTPLQRRYAKNIGYGWFYGLTNVKTAAKYISGADGEKVAGKILTGLKAMYPRIYKLMGQKSREAQKKGFLPHIAWPGRFRRFQTPGRPAPAYTALNALVQGGIGEFVKDVMLLVEDDLDCMGARLCLQVHDSLVIEVPEGTGEQVRELLQKAADDVNPFEMRMIFDGKPWQEHD